MVRVRSFPKAHCSRVPQEIRTLPRKSELNDKLICELKELNAAKCDTSTRVRYEPKIAKKVKKVQYYKNKCVTVNRHTEREECEIFIEQERGTITKIIIVIFEVI